eukprot:2329028-Rhodomonas_salina.3
MSSTCIYVAHSVLDYGRALRSPVLNYGMLVPGEAEGEQQKPYSTPTEPASTSGTNSAICLRSSCQIPGTELLYLVPGKRRRASYREA